MYQKLLILQTRMAQMIQEWHDSRLLYAGIEKMKLELQ